MDSLKTVLLNLISEYQSYQDYEYYAKRHFSQYFNYITAVSFTVPMVIVKRSCKLLSSRTVWRYQRGNQNP